MRWQSDRIAIERRKDHPLNKCLQLVLPQSSSNLVCTHHILRFTQKYLGTSSIVHEETHQPLLSTLSSVVETVVRLRAEGHKVVLVSSGAIGVGMKRMQKTKPKSLSAKQALAAIGQGRLIALWDDLFSHLEQPIAQILLTRADISDVRCSCSSSLQFTSNRSVRAILMLSTLSRNCCHLVLCLSSTRTIQCQLACVSRLARSFHTHPR